MASSTANLGLVLPFQSEAVSVTTQNDNLTKIDNAVNGLQDGMAILANGNTHAAIASGQYVYVRNHSSLAEGLYKATTAIATNGTLSTNNLTADSSGGLNDLQNQITTLNSKIVSYNFGSKTLDQFQSELVTYANSMGLRTYKHISVEISASSGLFLATTYVGTLEKLSSDARFVVTLRNAYEAAPGDIEMTYKDGTWTITSLSRNLATKTSYNSTIFSSVSITNDFVKDRVMQISCEIDQNNRTGQLSGYQSVNLKVTKENIILEAFKTTGTWETIWTK